MKTNKISNKLVIVKGILNSFLMKGILNLAVKMNIESNKPEKRKIIKSTEFHFGFFCLSVIEYFLLALIYVKYFDDKLE